MLSELIIFAVVLVAMNLLAGILMSIVMFKVLFSKRFVSFYCKKIVEMQEQIDEYL